MKKKILTASIFLIAFIIWTVAVANVHVEPIGPMQSCVGFAAWNSWFHQLTGVHMALYHITDLLSIIPIAIVLFFALTGLLQWIRRGKLRYVDYDILVLGGFYAAVLALFVFFETFVINYRPILIEGVLEPSYPSSTTMLVMCVMPTAMIQFHHRIKNPLIQRCFSVFLSNYTAFMVLGRLLSGVHWLTDIIGGILLSAGLVILYAALCSMEINRAR